MSEMFEKATRLKLRFESKQGSVTIEDLWDLPLQTQKANAASLDQIAVGLHRQIKDAAEISFVSETTRANELLQLRFDLVKYVIDVKKTEARAEAEKRDKAVTKARIVEMLARKQDESLAAKTEDELKQMLATL